MANFGENYRAGQSFTMCPLCECHIDSQFLSTKCPVIVDKIGSNVNIEDLYSNEIRPETVKTLKKINSIRENSKNIS